MTEAEWLNGCDPKPMLDYIALRLSGERKLRLFAAYCCRRVRERHDHRSGYVHPAVIASEQAADGLIGKSELREIERQIGAMGSYSASARAMDTARASVNESPLHAAKGASECAISYFLLSAAESVGDDVVRPQVAVMAEKLERSIQAASLREIVGNPFRPVKIQAKWLKPEVLKLARAASEHPGEHRILLGEALKSAGCNDVDIMAHCNQIGGHVKGCWVVDLLLQGITANSK